MLAFLSGWTPPGSRFTGIVFLSAQAITFLLSTLSSMALFDWEACVSAPSPRPGDIDLFWATLSHRGLEWWIFLLSAPASVSVAVARSREAKLLAVGFLLIPFLGVAEPTSMHDCDRHGVHGHPESLHVMVTLPLSLLLLFTVAVPERLRGARSEGRGRSSPADR